MPEIYIDLAEERRFEQKRWVAREVSDLLMRNFNVPPQVVIVHFVD